MKQAMHDDTITTSDLSEQQIGDSYEKLTLDKANVSYEIIWLERDLEEYMKWFPWMVELEAKRKHLVFLERFMAEQKEILLEKMLRNGIKSIETIKQKFTAKLNPGSVKIIDEKIIPEAFFNIPKPVINKILIKEALKEWQVVPGCELDKSHSLVITPK